MGNVLARLCPTVPPKLSFTYRRVHHSDVDVAQLCSNETLPDSRDALAVNPSSLVSTQSTTYIIGKPPFGPRVFQEHINFPFLTDGEIASWIVCTRFMFILRGPPGSGKSHITECIRLRFPCAHVCSADDFWYLESNGAEYQFDVNRIAEAHQWCQEKARSFAEAGYSPLVIDNTNVRAWETRFYTDLAREFEYTVMMVIPQTPWRFDAYALATKNVHFVGLQTVEAKVRNFEHVFPLYYGWHWPGKASNLGGEASFSVNRQMEIDDKFSPIEDTSHLLSWAWETFVIMVSIPDVRVQLAAAMGFADGIQVSELLRHWSSSTCPVFGRNLGISRTSSVPHITAMYARFGRAAGAEHYGFSKAVTESLLGRLFTVQVTGLFFSLRTVGLRVRLPADDIVLNHLYGSDDQAVLSYDLQDAELCGDPFAPQQRRPRGCRAHVSLALADEVPAVETGFDLLRIVDSELAGRPGEHIAVIPGGSLRRLTVRRPVSSSNGQQQSHFSTAAPGYEYMYVYDLDNPQHHRVLFAGAY